jgi:pyruvate dehydrogenase E2 component (dihydrolipoamide acetyltransferase)
MADGSVLVEIQMPELGAEVTEGTLLAWLVGVGDEVSAGDPIAELETDKSTVELEAEQSGTLREIVVTEGTESVPIGAVLAKLEAAASDEAASQASPAPEAAEGAAQAPAPVPAPAAEAAADSPGASPLARRLAEQAGVDLAGLAGSGARGKVVRADVEAATDGGGAAAPAPAPSPVVETQASAPTPTSDEGDVEGVVRVRHSAMRRTIARRLSESKQTVPHFYLRAACRVDELLRVRRTLNETSGDAKVSVNDFVVRAVALGLRDVPEANVSWSDEAMLQYPRVDVSVAVATEGGLITPVVRDADRKGLATLSGEIRELALRARDGKLRPEEYQGGNFTVSNLGMYGIETVYPIVNPPQASILGVGAASEQPVVVDGQIEVGHVMMCTLSADHRAVDGAVGAQFLAAVKRFIEDPISMVL